MILAVTNHDEPTSANASVCAVLVDGGAPQLFGANVVGSAFTDLIAHHPEVPAFFVGHGRADACVGNDGESVLAAADVACLSGRTTFALACHTASELGKSAAEAGGIWLGFAGAISCLLCDAGVADHFQKIPVFVRDKIYEINDGNADEFLSEFVSLCGDIESSLYDAEIFEMDAHVAVRWYRERIRAWLPNEIEPRRPVGFSEPALF